MALLAFAGVIALYGFMALPMLKTLGRFVGVLPPATPEFIHAATVRPANYAFPVTQDGVTPTPTPTRVFAAGVSTPTPAITVTEIYTNVVESGSSGIQEVLQDTPASTPTVLPTLVSTVFVVPTEYYPSGDTVVMGASGSPAITPSMVCYPARLCKALASGKAGVSANKKLSSENIGAMPSLDDTPTPAVVVMLPPGGVWLFDLYLPVVFHTVVLSVVPYPEP